MSFRISRWLLAGTALVVCACGSTASGGAALTPSATPTPLPSTPAPTPNLLANASAAYLAAATTANAADNALAKTFCGKTTYTTAQAKTCWPKYAAIEQTFLTAIYAIQYPPAMKVDVDAQITAVTKIIQGEGALAVSPSDIAAFNAWRTDTTAGVGAANIVRHDLGLPQVK
ncbi:MAG: hypothetical protein DLM65_07710 [Candidatus Aeolococcus gillhamiae]|uniref:Lipoprotein n=1 Tax=Candidatus Aeolococcus gillhamiae TaxID=3127015 RepID=A0A2W5ZCG5_9BACT|nr:MAG: hypothetical protein DLM65_07710 [Candidatus Dormibacter sp. RRmetagenome_bin12]